MLIKYNYKLSEFYDQDVEMMRGAAGLVKGAASMYSIKKETKLF